MRTHVARLAPSPQVVSTLAAVAYTALAITGGAVGGPGAIILGGGLALSTTAVGMQVLQDRGETGGWVFSLGVRVRYDCWMATLVRWPGRVGHGGGHADVRD